jgi:hypothetical protein
MAQYTSNIYGTTRAGTENFNSPQGAEIQACFNSRGDLLFAEALPERTEMARMGNLWTCRIATGNAFTYVNAWPTTRAELVLYNGEPTGGKCYVIVRAFIGGITTMAAAQFFTLLGQSVPVVATVPANDVAQLITGHNGKPAYTGAARVALANTTAGQIANLWDVLGSSNAPMTTSVGHALVADVWGLYVIPPKGVFALAGLSGTAAGTAIIGVTWAEVQLQLG